MPRNMRYGSMFAALALSMLAIQAADAQQAPQVQQRQVQPGQVQPAQPGQVQPAQPGQRLPGQPGAIQQTRPGAPIQAQQAGHGTHVMAHWLLVDNQGEIALAKFAQENAQNDEVKEFAKMMVQDHTDFVNNLQQVAGALNGQPGQSPQGIQPGQPPQRPGQLDQRPRGEADFQQQNSQQREQGQAQRDRQQDQGDQDRERAQAQRQGQQRDQDERTQPQGQAQQDRLQPGQPGQPGQFRNAQAGAPGQPPAMGFDIVRLKYELGQQCLASTKERLESKEGAEFDKCYMGHQLMTHMQMLDTLKVFKRHASGEFAELIQNGIATTEDHLMHAEKLVKQLDGGAAASTARRPGAQRD